MKLKAEQLQQHLNQGLSPIYILSGETSLLVQEARDSILACARHHGFTDREVHHHNRSFNWNQFLENAASLSLFGDKKIIELRLNHDKPNDTGKKALATYSQSPPDDTLLLISTEKIDAATQKAKWFKPLESTGVWIQFFPPNAQQLPLWIKKRMQSAGLQAQTETLQLIADRVEGNVLAAAQEIEKLKLLYGTGTIDTDQVLKAVSMSSRFDVFSLVDTALKGETEKALRMITNIKSEGTDATVVLWALTREIRSLCTMRDKFDQGTSIRTLLQEFRIWNNRKAVVQRALNGLTLDTFHQLLHQSSLIDRAIKGSAAFDPWDGINTLLIQLSGFKMDHRVLRLPR